MNFRVGQEVVIRRNRGEDSGHQKSEYYHGGNLKSVPLGAKATVKSVLDNDKLLLRFENRRYGSSGEWYVHPNELQITEEQAKREKEQEQKVSSLLEDVLMAEPIASDNGSVSQNGFNPRFNAREEFAVWVRQEFPELKTYADKDKKYDILLKREKEIMNGAKLVYKHAMGTVSGGCVRGLFRDSYKTLNENTTGLAYRLENFVKLIERVSSNLGGA